MTENEQIIENAIRSIWNRFYAYARPWRKQSDKYIKLHKKDIRGSMKLTVKANKIALKETK